MPNIAVIGAQWGDEGKGKVVDLLSEHFDVVARFQGGPNAGHTVTFDGRRHALHHVPSGVFREDTRIVIGNGTVIDLGRLLEELDGLEQAGVGLAGRLYISDRAHVILPAMRALDALRESSAQSGNRIGTTLRGIGPTYEAKAARWGVRTGDLLDRDYLAQRIGDIMGGEVGRKLAEAGCDVPPEHEVVDCAYEQGRRLAPYIADSSLLLNNWMDEGRRVLFEGAQGTLLDLDHGSYPFVTSSCVLAGGLCGGLGVAPSRVGGVLGVFKAYCTRVGGGPMPTELHDADGERIRERGREFGTTTGRPRRCGWFDGVAARYAHRLNRFDAVCIMLLDVLAGFDELKICTGYRLGDEVLDHLPTAADLQARCAPVYETMPGWKTTTAGARSWADLPAEAIKYVRRVEELIGCPVALLSTSPERDDTILVTDPFAD